MDLQGELQFGENRHLSLEEATLYRRIKHLTKERDELISEERELEMALKQRKETGKNIKARVKSILHHPSAKTIATELTPCATLEKRKRNVSACLTVLGRQLVTLDQQILAQSEESLAEQDKESETQSIDSVDESICNCQIIIELIH